MLNVSLFDCTRAWMKVLRGRLESGPKITVNYLLYMSSNADEPWKHTQITSSHFVFLHKILQKCSSFDLDMTYFISHPAKKNHVPFFSSSRRTKASVRMFLWMSSHSGDLELHFWAICTTVSSSHLLYTSLSSFMILILSCTLHYSCSSWRWKDMKKNEQMCQK